MSINDIFYVAIVIVGIISITDKLTLLYAIHRYTALHHKPEQDQ